jgi:hypothetical protein
MTLDQITIGQTYRGTLRETGLVKNRGGYYTGTTRKETGKICTVEFRVDRVQGDNLWGNWTEVCGARRSVSTYFTAHKLALVSL